MASVNSRGDMDHRVNNYSRLMDQEWIQSVARKHMLWIDTSPGIPYRLDLSTRVMFIGVPRFGVPSQM